MRKSNLTAALLLAGLLLTTTAVGRPDAGASSPIRAEELYSWCKFLAQPSFQGRLTGHEGYA